MPILSSEPSFFPASLPFDLATDGQYEEQMEKETCRSWWLVYTRSRQEKSLARELYRHQIPFYLPLVGQFHHYKGRKVRSFLPMFSGYLFLFGTHDEQLWTFTTKRVCKTIEVNDQSRLQRDLLQVHQLIEADAPMTIEQRLECGTPVRIKSGSLKGLEGQIVERRGKTRLLVAVEYIQQGILVDIDDFMLEAA